MEMPESNGVPSTTTAHIHHHPKPLGQSGDNSSAFAHISHQLPRQGRETFNTFTMMAERSTGYPGAAYSPNSGSVSPHTHAPMGKSVTFELIISKDSQLHARARLPLRVTIFPHDNTDSIISTVNSFFGLSARTGDPPVGISFEDERANTLIARWDNFRDKDIVFVRVIGELAPVSPALGGYGDEHGYPAAGHQRLGEVLQGGAQQPYGQRISGPMSGVSRVRGQSPNGLRGRRSTSTGPTGKNGRSRSAKKSTPGSQDGYTSGDGAPASPSSRAKDHLHTTEISVENIVEGGRRKRAKFDSSELPLFAPPQMPAATSNSSVSPARRVDQHRHSLPAIHGGQNPFSNPRPLESPRQFYTDGYSQHNAYQTPGYDSRRSRASYGYGQDPAAMPVDGVIPTPEPTIGTSMSEEDKDVAIQLMRLGELPSNMSHGRTSGSTYEDVFSARANTTPSTGATSDAEDDVADEAPPQRRQKIDASGHHKKIFNTTESHFAIPQPSVEGNGDSHEGAGVGSMAAPRTKGKPGPVNGAKPRPLAKTKPTKSAKPKVKKAVSAGPMSPASLPASRKQSVASNFASPLAPGEDEHPDLSTKPRCQRCRKSKKGCDRQRPCGRCKDAGLSAEACISEDETNGRKGRYGRHMGVPLVQDEAAPVPHALLPAAPIATAGDAAAAIACLADKNKKRKR